MADGTKDSPDLQFLRRFARDQLINILETNPEKQDLVIDQLLMKPMDRIAGATFLKVIVIGYGKVYDSWDQSFVWVHWGWLNSFEEHGIDKIFKLERAKPDTCCASQVYIVRPNMEQVKYISDHINADKISGNKKKYKLIFVPTKFYLCEMILEQEGVYGDVTMDELTIDFIPMDNDVLSMEIPDFFRDYFLEGDQHWLNTISHGIMTLQTIFGTIPNIYGVGNCAKLVNNMLNIMVDEKGVFTPPDGPEIDTLFLIDRVEMVEICGMKRFGKLVDMLMTWVKDSRKRSRNVDYVTPFCSQVTYEGLIDDIFQIKTGFVVFDQTVTADKSITMLLNSQDVVYKEIRDRHFTNVFGYLSLKAKELQTGYDKRNTLTSVGDMKQFVSTELRNLKQQHKSLATHIGACESILKLKTEEHFENQLGTEHDILEGLEDKDTIGFIEELILKQLPYYRSLQLICLLSVTRNGLDSKLYKSLRQQFLQTYGHQHLVNFFNLKKLGVLTENEKRNSFRTLSRKLNLIPKSADTIDLKSPTDMAYVFGGAYAPLSCKLVEQVCSRSGFLGLEDITKLLGETFTTKRGTSARVTSTASGKSNKKVILVFFLGGCTYSEITSLRFLGKQKGWKIIIGTTSITNCKRLLESVKDVS